MCTHICTHVATSLSPVSLSLPLPPSLSLSLPLSLSLFAVEHLSVNSLQEIFNVTGVQTLEHTAEIPPSQLRTIIMELYTTLRTLKPILGTSKLKLAQELCFNWLQMVYECAEGGTIDCGSLKLIMCMFMGGKPADKSRCKMAAVITIFVLVYPPPPP